MEVMEATLMLEELQSAVAALAKDKVPGPDGVPAEFFVILWDTVGPTLLEALLHGLEAGILNEEFTKGLIVLLCKIGDQRYFKNKTGAYFTQCTHDLTQSSHPTLAIPHKVIHRLGQVHA
ncbi:unnamed protein product [Calypogeia fissa]